MGERMETIVIGGGQAGLSTSYYLNRLGHEHVMLEQAEQAGNACATTAGTPSPS